MQAAARGTVGVENVAKKLGAPTRPRPFEALGTRHGRGPPPPVGPRAVRAARGAGRRAGRNYSSVDVQLAPF